MAKLALLLQQLKETDQIILYDQRGSDTPLSDQQHMLLIGLVERALKMKRGSPRR
jgi:hypothetical protein